MAVFVLLLPVFFCVTLLTSASLFLLAERPLSLAPGASSLKPAPAVG